MKKIYFLIAFAAVLTVGLQACNSGKKNVKNEEAGQTAVASVIQVDELLAKGDSLTGQSVDVEGVCTHICAHGGGKIFLMGSDDTQIIRIEAGEKIGSFKPETVNNLIHVKGVLVEDRIDEAYLVGWENRLKEQTAKKNGDGKDGCATEQKAQGQSAVDSQQERIDNFRKRIAARQEKEGKNYLSFYHVNASEYIIQK